MLIPCLQSKNTRLRRAISVEAHFGAYVNYISDESRYRKIANTFGVSRTTISSKISSRKVSRAVTTFLGPLTKITKDRDGSKFRKIWLFTVYWSN